MNRLCSHTLIVLSLLCAIPLSAQTQPPEEPQPEPAPAPVAPPSPNASAADLELRGDILRAEKDYLDSIDFYRAAIKKTDTAALHNKVGVASLQLSKYIDAKKEFERAVKLDHKAAEAYNNLGVCYYVNQQYSKAAKEYSRAIALDPTSAAFHSNLGSAYFSRKNFDRANKEYAEAMRLDPSIFDPSASGGVSIKLATQGDRAYFHYMIAKMYGAKGDAEHCRLYLAKASEDGYTHVKDALKDPAFLILRKDPEFVEFIKSLKPPAPLEANN